MEDWGDERADWHREDRRGVVPALAIVEGTVRLKHMVNVGGVQTAVKQKFPLSPQTRVGVHVLFAAYLQQVLPTPPHHALGGLAQASFPSCITPSPFFNPLPWTRLYPSVPPPVHPRVALAPFDLSFLAPFVPRHLTPAFASCPLGLGPGTPHPISNQWEFATWPKGRVGLPRERFSATRFRRRLERASLASRNGAKGREDGEFEGSQCV